MAISIITSHLQQCDSNGVPLNAGTVDVYAAGTTTPLSLFSDAGLTAAAPGANGGNPITLDASGRHAMTYIATAAYKIVVKNSAGTTIYTHDDIDPGVAVGSGALAVANGGTGATTAAAARTNLAAASAADMATAQADVSNIQTWIGYLLTTITRIASGTTAQEPVAANAGFRWNSTTGFLRFCTGSAWKNIPYSGQLVPADFATGSTVQCLKRSRTTLATSQTISATIPTDNTIPQIGEGTEVTGFNVSFTPNSGTTSSIRVLVRLQVHIGSGVEAVAALFRNSAADAVSSVMILGDAASSNSQVVTLTYEFTPASASAVTFSVRMGSQAGGTIILNADGAGTPATLGDTRVSEFIIEEWLSP